MPKTYLDKYNDGFDGTSNGKDVGDEELTLDSIHRSETDQMMRGMWMCNFDLNTNR